MPTPPSYYPQLYDQLLTHSLQHFSLHLLQLSSWLSLISLVFSFFLRVVSDLIHLYPQDSRRDEGRFSEHHGVLAGSTYESICRSGTLGHRNMLELLSISKYMQIIYT